MNFKEALLSGGNDFVGKRKIHRVQQETKDVLQQADALPFWSQDYTQLERGAFAGSVTSVTALNMQIFRESMNRAVDQIASAPEETYVIGLPTIVDGNASWGGTTVKQGQLITLEKNAELLFRTAHFSEIIATVVTAQRLEEYAHEVEAVDLRKIMSRVNPVESIPVELSQRILAALNISINYISTSNDNPNIKHVLRHFEDNLMHHCLLALMHARNCQERHYDQRIHRHIVNRVRELTLSHDEVLTIGDICMNLHISRRTLNHAFSRVLDITPIEYMRYLRLHRVRAELQTSSDDNTFIADVAAKWGFWHMSLFSRYYRELFGECPRETLKDSRTQTNIILNIGQNLTQQHK